MIKKTVSGVDVKANPRLVMYQSLSTLINMRQYGNESNDEYIAILTSNIQTLEIDKGGHLLYFPELMEAVDKDNPTKEEITKEEEKIKAILCLERDD